VQDTVEQQVEDPIETQKVKSEKICETTNQEREDPDETKEVEKEKEG
jgi:hypothetical protein